MTRHMTRTREEGLAARLELLEVEKELTRRSDELARRRQELPWARFDRAGFPGPGLGKITSDGGELFGVAGERFIWKVKGEDLALARLWRSEAAHDRRHARAHKGRPLIEPGMVLAGRVTVRGETPPSFDVEFRAPRSRRHCP